MKLDDALFNWLQIRVVADARPHDRSAQDTADFFREILTQDHQVEELAYRKDDEIYELSYTAGGSPGLRRYDTETVEQLLIAIENEPKYNQ